VVVAAVNDAPQKRVSFRAVPAHIHG
jgi:hypothetical protein